MSNAIIKSTSEIALMRESGALLAQVFKALDEKMAIGISTLEKGGYIADSSKMYVMGNVSVAIKNYLPSGNTPFW